MRISSRSTNENQSRTNRLARVGLTGALLASSVMAVFSPVTQAQSDALLSTSTVVPADIAIYAEVSLDTDSTQLQQLDDLLIRLGSEDSLIDAIDDVAGDTEIGGQNVTLAGAEIAIAVLPSALASNSDAGSVIDEVGGISDVEDASNVASDLSSGVDGEGVVIVIKATDPDALEAEALDDAGADATTETYLGSDIVSDVEEGGSPSYFTRIDDFMLVGQSVDDLKLFIDASLDGGTSLAGFEPFTSASAALPDDRVAFAFANGPVIFEAVNEQIAEPSLAGIVNEAFSVFSGYIGITIAADPAGLRVETVNTPVVATTMETSATADLTMADRMPIDTVVFANGFDLGQTTLLKSVGLLLVAALGTLSSDSMEGDSVATPEPISVDEMYDSLAQLLGFNIKTDFIDQMTGEYGFGLWGIESGNVADIGVALVSGVADTEVLGDTVDSISFLVQAAGQGEVSVTSRELATGPINNVTFEADGAEMSVDYGVVGDEFILGVGNGADMVTGGATESLSDSSSYIEAMSYLPTEYTSILYVDIAALGAIGSDMSGTVFEGNDMLTGLASDSDIPVESLAAVSWTEDGSGRTSLIVVVP